MKRLAAALAAGAFALGLLPGMAAAQEKKITVMTWNIPYFEEGFQTWVDEFKKLHPDFTVERIDMKGTELPTFYQTQVVAGTPPDIVDVQGGLWLEYASQGGLADLTPFLERDKDYTGRLYPEVPRQLGIRGQELRRSALCQQDAALPQPEDDAGSRDRQGSRKLRRDHGGRRKDGGRREDRPDDAQFRLAVLAALRHERHRIRQRGRHRGSLQHAGNRGAGRSDWPKPRRRA